MRVLGEVMRHDGVTRDGTHRRHSGMPDSSMGGKGRFCKLAQRGGENRTEVRAERRRCGIYTVHPCPSRAASASWRISVASSSNSKVRPGSPHPAAVTESAAARDQ